MIPVRIHPGKRGEQLGFLGEEGGKCLLDDSLPEGLDRTR